ncbi:MAG TPA: hypothetical protein VF590_26845, partial [Isosphaeraceae bacterium]
MGAFLGPHRPGTGRASGRSTARPRVEALEGRRLPATFTVSTAADGDAGSLRQAILDANGSPGADVIDFRIGSGAQTIRPTSALPEITDPVDLDATTQPGFAGRPIIELDGSGAGLGVDGLSIRAGDSLVQGLVINRFTGSGIALTGRGGNVIRGNYLGPDLTGRRAADDAGDLFGNLQGGMSLNRSGSNTIGGSAPGQGNVISGNLVQGVRVLGAGSSRNQFWGNIIGLDAAGRHRLDNIGPGVSVVDSGENAIGGSAPGQGNVISGNRGDGVQLMGQGAIGNRVVGNIVGLDATGRNLFIDGSIAVTTTNGGAGVLLNFAPGTVIGGTIPGAGNVIAGNTGEGIRVTLSLGTLIAGNFIGCDAAGTTAFANLQSGVSLLMTAVTTIGGTTAGARNVISGNRGNGVEIALGSTANQVQGNFIGTDVTGTRTLLEPSPVGSIGGVGNLQNGVLIDLAGLNTVGGPAAGARNIIAGNRGNGVAISNSAPNPALSATGNVVQGNSIGLDVTGRRGLGNLTNGVAVLDTPGNLIGGMDPGTGNAISGNRSIGVVIFGSNAVGNLVQGNAIGTDVSGSRAVDDRGAALGNLQSGVSLQDAGSNTIGGDAPGQGNVIAGNLVHGVQVLGGGASRNLIAGNRIGLDHGGGTGLGNVQDGVNVNNAPGTLVGGSTPGSRNLIAGNGGNGVTILGAAAGDTRVEGNFIGLDATGTRALGNALVGVLVNGAAGTRLGGAAPAGNVISGNRGNGVELIGGVGGTTILNNLIGPAADGVSAVGNGADGLRVNNTGRPAPGRLPIVVRDNVLSANAAAGLEILGDSEQVTVQANSIGTDRSGSRALGNEFGVFLNDAVNNTIGGAGAGTGNVISGNRNIGVQIFRVSPVLGEQINGGAVLGNAILGNFIGTDATGRRALGNGDPRDTTGTIGVGVFINAAAGNTIGGTAPGAGNVISANSSAGVFIIGQVQVASDANRSLSDSNLTNRVLGNTIGGSVDGGQLAGTENDPFDRPSRQDLGVLINASVDNIIRSNVVTDNLGGVEIVGVTTNDANPTCRTPRSNRVEANQLRRNLLGVFLNSATA